MRPASYFKFETPGLEVIDGYSVTVHAKKHADLFSSIYMIQLIGIGIWVLYFYTIYFYF